MFYIARFLDMFTHILADSFFIESDIGSTGAQLLILIRVTNAFEV